VNTPQRRAEATEKRIRIAEQSLAGNTPVHGGNGEETDYPYVANYAKGLPHDDAGQVDPEAYRLMVRALQSGEWDDFERIPLGGAKPLATDGPRRPADRHSAGPADRFRAELRGNGRTVLDGAVP
jgi:hypothetical protein